MKNGKNIRYLRVYYLPSQRERGCRFVPYIRLSGVWIEELGFKIGHRIKVVVIDDGLVITNEEKNDAEDKTE